MLKPHSQTQNPSTSPNSSSQVHIQSPITFSQALTNLEVCHLHEVNGLQKVIVEQRKAFDESKELWKKTEDQLVATIKSLTEENRQVLQMYKKAQQVLERYKHQLSKFHPKKGIKRSNTNEEVEEHRKERRKEELMINHHPTSSSSSSSSSSFSSSHRRHSHPFPRFQVDVDVDVDVDIDPDNVKESHYEDQDEEEDGDNDNNNNSNDEVAVTKSKNDTKRKSINTSDDAVNLIDVDDSQSIQSLFPPISRTNSVGSPSRKTTPKTAKTIPTTMTLTGLTKTRAKSPSNISPNQQITTSSASTSSSSHTNTPTSKSSNNIASTPNFKYDSVVRKKSERQSLPSHECQQCKDFYEELGEEVDRNKIVTKCSRHRHLHERPNTPDGYWNTSFPD